MKDKVVCFVFAMYVCASLADDLTIPSMRPDGQPAPKPPVYQSKALDVQDIKVDLPVGTLNFEAGMPAAGRVAVVVDPTLYPNVSAGVTSYVADLTTHGFTPFVVTFAGTAEQLRALLQGYYAEQDSLVGAVLVGDLPYAVWEMMKSYSTTYYEASICDFFLMDMDGVWEDNNSSSPFSAGYYDTRSGDLHCEIWVSRIAAQNMVIGSNTEADLINGYFTRNNAYRSGSMTVSKTALHYTDTDWNGNADDDENELSGVYGTVDVRAVGIDAGTGGVDYRDNYLNADYELIQVRVHGTATAQHWDDGIITTSSDYLIKDPQAVFYNIFTCSGADFTSQNCLTRSAVMNPDASGLVAWSNTGTGGMISLGFGHSSTVFYSALGIGECVGEAFRLWYNSCVDVDEHFVNPVTPRWFGGMRIDGDGCMTIRTPVIRYVSKTGGNTYPYTSEATAARSVNDAFDAAGAGDIILVGAGRYMLTEAIIMTDTKYVTLRGTAPDAAAILDASQMAVADRCIQSYYEVDAVIENLTLTGGTSVYGGINSPGGGGGARLRGGAIRDCVITGNTASSGGGLYLDCDTFVERCRIEGNTATGSGGGFITWDEEVKMVDTVVSNNVSGEGGGGGITTDGGLYERCVFVDNEAGSNGGGLWMVGEHTRVLNCYVVDNTAVAHGGGLYAPRGNAVSVLVAGNHAGGDGGGVYADGYLLPVGITNITVTANTCDGTADGFYLGSDIGVLNCIVYGNGTDDFYWNGETSQTSVAYCCLGESYAGPGVDNFVADPGFVGGGDYTLSSASICVNAGLTLPWMVPSQQPGGGATPAVSSEQIDLAGNMRVSAGIVDLGAYERYVVSGVYPTPGILSFSTYEGYNPDWTDFSVQTQESNNFAVICSGGESWLILNSSLTTGGIVDSDTSLDGEVGCNTSGLIPGTYNTVLNVMTNGAVAAVQVPVELKVYDLVTDILAFDPIDSAQGTGVAFNVTLTASNNAGFVALNHDDDVTLSAYAPGGLESITETSGAGTAETERLLYSYYEDSRSQIIYLASELDNESGSITNIAFYVTDDPGQTLNSFTVRFQHTTLTELDSNDFIASGWHTGFSGNLAASYFTENSWVNIPIDPPFEYNGTDNLWVDFSFNNSSYSSNGEVRYTSNGFARNLHGRSDSYHGDPLLWGAGNTPSVSQITDVPNLQFMMNRESVEEIALSPSAAAGVDFTDGVWSDGVVINSAYSNIYIVAECGSILATSSLFHVENELPSPIPASWLSGFSLPANIDPYGNPDNDPFTTLQEYIADTNPTDSNDYFHITAVSNNSPFTVYFNSSGNRNYTLLSCTNLIEGSWQPLVGPRMGTGGADSMTHDSTSPANFYKVRVELP